MSILRNLDLNLDTRQSGVPDSRVVTEGDCDPGPSPETLLTLCLRPRPTPPGTSRVTPVDITQTRTTSPNPTSLVTEVPDLGFPDTWGFHLGTQTTPPFEG